MTSCTNKNRSFGGAVSTVSTILVACFVGSSGFPLYQQQPLRKALRAEEEIGKHVPLRENRRGRLISKPFPYYLLGSMLESGNWIGDGTGSTLLMDRRKLMSSCAKSIFQVGAVTAILTPFCADASTDIGVDEDNKTMTTADVPLPLSVDVKAFETDLYEMCFRRKPNDYNVQEWERIESLIDNIVILSRGTNSWDQNLLPGTWRVAYIRSGEGGGGLDRRIPFPEFSFNQSYQRFTLDTVTNIGEVLGPNVRVEVKGSLREENIGSNQVPKRFRALITGGESELCAGTLSFKLPIEGTGVFDGVFLGEEIRIGQNLNGS
eukprot:CAMPEP_0194108098 /NCGR_PEP_ID=MMETSP0150-20130528/7862_1 /TAXON_ID=122233 /ORGANISM="Chaetoceros debilis, Strain MM31A-1" /LENGTH=319 /DNA_ID=CAMNT_0038796709 /DNA_START=27 /DNA_END=983 /DNA_ORIENTATION=-